MNIDIKRVAKLARLRIEEEKLDKFEREMESIVAMVENLPELTDKAVGLDPSRPMGLREDKIRPSLKRGELLANAPQTQAGCVVVPKTVE